MTSKFKFCYTSPLTQFSKFNNFLWVCWFLGKNLSDFVPPVWKLHYPYCHSVGKREIFPKPASFLMKICDNFHFSQKGLKVVWWRAGTQRYGTKFESTFQLTMKGCVKTLLDVSLKKILRNSMLQMHGHSTQEEFWSQYFKFFL